MEARGRAQTASVIARGASDAARPSHRAGGARSSAVGKGKLRAGQSVFIHGCLGGVGRTAAQIAWIHGASVGGSCRATAREDAQALGIVPVVDFGFDPATLKGRFDIVLDTAGTLPVKAARTLLKPRGRIIDINVNPRQAPQMPPARTCTSSSCGHSSMARTAVSRADLGLDHNEALAPGNLAPPAMELSGDTASGSGGVSVPLPKAARLGARENGGAQQCAVLQYRDE